MRGAALNLKRRKKDKKLYVSSSIPSGKYTKTQFVSQITIKKGMHALFSHILSVKTCYLIFFLVAKFAMEKIQPLVPEMDKNSETDPSVIRGMFEQGVSF